MLLSCVFVYDYQKGDLLIMNRTQVSQLRKQHGWTQEMLAEHAYVTVRTIQRLEAGEEVNKDTLNSVASALNVSINDLFETIDDESTELKVRELSKNRTLQMNQRNTEYQTYKLLLIAFIFLFLSLFGFYISTINGDNQNVLGILWVFSILLCIALARYFLKGYLSQKMDQKYPLTIGVPVNDTNDKHDEPINNGWQFLARYWWIVFPIAGVLTGLISSFN